MDAAVEWYEDVVAQRNWLWTDTQILIRIQTRKPAVFDGAGLRVFFVCGILLQPPCFLFCCMLCYIKYAIIHRSNAMNIPNLTIGERLKSIRQSRNMSLDDVSKLTGVSKPMIGQIERGQSSPTVNTLWKISTGLRIPLSFFLQEQQAKYRVVNLEDKDLVLGNNGKMKASPVFSFDPLRSFESFYIEFDSGCNHDSEKHMDGVEEYIFVIQGKLDLFINGEKVTLAEKQAIRFAANVPHSYRNPYKNLCTIYDMIFYPND